MDADEATRVRLAAGTGTAPQVLQRLSRDPSVTVRATLALNPGAPAEVEADLAHDADERVRIVLARRLGALVPNLSEAAQARLQQQTFETLTALVSDEAVRVRAAIAEEVRHMPDAPRAVILRLAHDPAVMVCEPVIRFSPMLTPQDLVALVATPPSPATLTAVARRPGLDETVSDAIAATCDSEAITALLSNASAQIREATLDVLAAQAADHTAWHEPLATRPALPPRAARALAEIVAAHLLEALAARPDFDPNLAQELHARLRARFRPVDDSQPAPSDQITALSQARSLNRAGRLTEDALLAAGRRGDTGLATSLLAVKAGVPVAAVERAASLRSAKGLVSLVWKAGFSMRAAGAMQSLLARLPPDAIMGARPDGGFPLSIEEMTWQVDFLRRPER